MNLNEVIKFLVTCNPGDKVRTNWAVAHEILMNDVSFIRGGKVFFISIKNLGLGVYEVGARDKAK